MRRIAAGARTSLLHWEAAAPSVDEHGLSYAVIGVGPQAALITDHWRDAIAERGLPLWLRQADTLDDALLGELAQHMAQAQVGWRLMLAGPEADLLQIRCTALGAGAVNSEIRMHATSTDKRRLYCAHCATTFETDAPLLDVAVCAGCGLNLLVYYHVSPTLGAYLGFRVDAEELPA